MSVSSEPTYLTDQEGNRTLNPFFQRSESYSPHIEVMRKEGLDTGLPPMIHAHQWEIVDDEDIGLSVRCVLCLMGKILPPNLTVVGGTIVSTSEPNDPAGQIIGG